MKTAVYVRVSTVNQNLEGQRFALNAWLSGHGISDAVWYEDIGKSGDSMERPALERLKSDIFSGRVRTVVCFKLDRLSRSMQDGIGLICSWLKQDVRIVSITQQLDFSGTVGQMVAAVLLAVAQMEQETRRERQAVGIAVARRDGRYKGRKPGTHKADVKRVHELQRQGLTRQEISAAVGVSPRTVTRYLAQAV